MKRILILMTSLVGGGAEKALVEMLGLFDYSSYQVTLCLLYYEGVYLERIPKSVKVVVLYPKLNSLYRKSFRYYRKYQWTFLFKYILWRRKELEVSYDAIVSYMEGYPLVFHSLLADRSSKNISWVHCDLADFHYTVPDAFNEYVNEESAYAKMTDIVFVSEMIKDKFERMYSIQNKHHCLYNVVNVDDILKKSSLFELPQRENIVIVTIGRLVSVKRYDRLVRLAKRLDDDGFNFTVQIIGLGEELDNLKDLVIKLGVEHRIEFLGFQSNPYPFLKNADLYLSTSSSEGLSLVICEALSLGVPVVATDTAGARELLNDGEYGVLVSQNDEAIYEGIVPLLNNPELRTTYSEKAKDRSKIFDVNSVMENVYKILG